MWFNFYPRFLLFSLLTHAHTHTHRPTKYYYCYYRVLITLISLYSFICKPHHGMHERERSLYDSLCVFVCFCVCVFLFLFCTFANASQTLCLFSVCFFFLYSITITSLFLTFYLFHSNLHLFFCCVLCPFSSFFLPFRFPLQLHPPKTGCFFRSFSGIFRSEWFRFDCCGATNLCLCVCMCGFSKSISF